MEHNKKDKKIIESSTINFGDIVFGENTNTDRFNFDKIFIDVYEDWVELLFVGNGRPVKVFKFDLKFWSSYDIKAIVNTILKEANKHKSESNPIMVDQIFYDVFWNY